MAVSKKEFENGITWNGKNTQELSDGLMTRVYGTIDQITEDERMTFYNKKILNSWSEHDAAMIAKKSIEEIRIDNSTAYTKIMNTIDNISIWSFTFEEKLRNETMANIDMIRHYSRISSYARSVKEKEWKEELNKEFEIEAKIIYTNLIWHIKDRVNNSL